MEPLKQSWNALESSLHPAIIETLKEDMGFSQIMPVQKTVIPLFSANYDVTVESCTGSGKTLAFLLPLVNKLIETSLKNDNEDILINTWPKGLVISPTRELAVQIHKVLQTISKGIQKREIGEIVSVSLIGGKQKGKINPGQAMKKWKSTRDKSKKFIGSVWVGTPGRLREEMFQADPNGNYYYIIFINKKNVKKDLEILKCLF